MPLHLKTKITLTTSILVLGVAAVISSAYVATFTRLIIRQDEADARAVAQEDPQPHG